MEQNKREDQQVHNFEASSSSPNITISFQDQISTTNMNASTSIINNNNNNNNLFLSSQLEEEEEDESITIFPSTSSNEIASYGFMELLTVPDYTSSLFDWLPTFKAETSTDEEVILVSSEVQNTPAVSLQASCSIASSSNEATTNKMKEEEHHEEDKVVETRNKQRKQKEPRYVFHTNTKVTNLEDGFKWRKYGQKSVKNTPFPRSYYRCTTQGCGVKKRVERSSEDHGVVVTTYEGNHTHFPPNEPRISSLNFMHNACSTNGGEGVGLLPPPQQHQQFNQPIIPHNFQHSNVKQQQQSAPLLHNSNTTPRLSNYVNPTSSFCSFVQGHENHGGGFAQSNNSTPPMSNYINSTSSFSGYVQEEHENNGGDVGPSDMLIDNEAFLRNIGLLEDILMSARMRTK